MPDENELLRKGQAREAVLTDDQIEAIRSASSPSRANPFSTASDSGGGPVDASDINTAVAPGPTVEDTLAALAAAPSAGASRWLGPYTLLYTDSLIPGVAEVSEIAVDTPTPDGGTFDLFFSNIDPATGIAWNATAAQIKSAIEAALPDGYATVVATGGPLPATVTVSMTPLGVAEVEFLTIDSTNLTNGTYVATEITPGQERQSPGRALFPVAVGDLLLSAEVFIKTLFSAGAQLRFVMSPAFGDWDDTDWQLATMSAGGGDDDYTGPLVVKIATSPSIRHSTQDTAAAADLFKSRVTKVLEAGTLYVVEDGGILGGISSKEAGELEIYVQVATPALA